MRRRFFQDQELLREGNSTIARETLLRRKFDYGNKALL